jgi:23S rRNA (cytosine1962-C5)-methyltransferase
VSGAGDPFALVGSVRLKRGRDAAARRRHPWVYRGALIDPAPPAGPVAVVAADGSALGVALAAAGDGSLALRMVAWEGETWSAELLRARLADAAALRARLAIDSDAWRVVHAEGDFLPGLVIDRYRDVAVIEVFDPSWLAYRGELVAHLAGEAGCATVLLRRGDGRAAVEALRGAVPAAPVELREGRLAIPVDLVGGHKTGFYLDQRDNRRRLGELAGGAEVLNLFSYSAGFSLAALAGGARRALNVDASVAAMALAREGYRRNGFAVADGDFVVGDAFAVTRALAAATARFDVVVVDPPSFVHRKSELAGGLRGLKDINLQALKLVRPGGLLLTCSCSALVDHEVFAVALADAAADAARAVRVLEVRGAAPDHPLALACRETRHLQAWLCQVS